MRWLSGSRSGELGRVLAVSLASWVVISACLSLFVIVTYPGSAPWSSVAVSQFSNWMPFAVFYPALRIAQVRLKVSERNRLIRGLTWIGAAVLLTVLYLLMRQLSLTLFSTGHEVEGNHGLGGFARMWPIAFMVYCVVLALAQGAHSKELRQRAERERNDLKIQLADARLEALEAQLRPHFLFNTLQAVENACWEEPAAASKMVLDLADLLRASLKPASGRESSTLGSELALARKYMSIQTARFGTRLHFEETVDAQLLEQPLPRLFLQPLLENAVMHGVELLPQGGCIELRAAATGEHAVLEIVNDTPQGGLAKDTPGFGIGMQSSLARLQALYGPEVTLEFSRASTGQVTVRTVLPLRSAK